MEAMTDDQIVEMLTEAALPAKYRDKERGLKSAGRLGQEASEWFAINGESELRAIGGVVEFVAKSQVGIDAYYLTLRGLLLRRFSALCCHARELLEGRDRLDWLTDRLEARVLAMEGLVTDHAGQFTEAEKSKLQCLLMRWLNQRGVLVFLHDRAISGADEFTQSFRNRISGAMVMRFEES